MENLCEYATNQEVNEYAYKIIKKLMEKHYITYKLMLGSDHNSLKEKFYSEWHIEGSVWTHTMMVMSHLKLICKTSPNWKLLLLAGLLHDIGKPACRLFNKEKNRVTFYGHPGMSTLLAVDIINDIEPELDDKEKVYVLKLINYHQVLFGISDNPSEKSKNKLISKFNSALGVRLLSDINIHRKADYYGNLANRDDGIGYDFVKDIIDSFVGTTRPVDNKQKPIAYIMMGLPGSGKSTYINANFPGFQVISRDSHIMNSAPEYETYNEKWDHVDQKHVTSCFNAELTDAIINRRNIIIDQTNLTHKGRMKFINQLRSNDYNVEIIVLLPGYKTSWERNTSRSGKVINLNVIMNMAKSIELPFDNECMTHYLFNY